MIEAKRRILILDDEISSCRLVRKILVNSGYECGYINQSEQLFSRLEERWDLLLLDLNMPDRDGFSILKELKEDLKSNLPVIVLTAETSEQATDRCFSLGAVDFVSKPISEKVLLARVRNTLAIYGQIDGHRRRIEDLIGEFRRFVPTELVEGIYDGSYKTGEFVTRHYTVFFADIRSFTQLSEQLDPDQLYRLLNRIYRLMEEAISEHDGVVDKFIGDAVMGLFGGEHGASNALKAATALHKKIDHFNLVEKEEGLRTVQIGVGLHSGNVSLGALGSERRVTPTVIGDTVNVASRIEQLTKRFKARILISGSTHDRILDEKRGIRQIERLRVRGKKESLVIYEVYDCDSAFIREQKKSTQEILEEGVDHYCRQDFNTALDKFFKCFEMFQSDSLVYDYIKRCHYFIKFPPTHQNLLDIDENLLLDWSYRRRFVRRPSNEKVNIISGLDEKQQKKHIEGKLMEISMMGLSVKMQGYVRQGDTLQVNIFLPNRDNSNISVAGKVIWVNVIDSNASMAGLETQALDHLSNLLIESYVSERSTQQQQKVKVLILDDELAFCKQLRATLQKKQH